MRFTISITGHRPDKLGGYNWGTPKNKEIMLRLKETFKELINKGADKFIVGGAIGIDQMACDVLLHLREIDKLPIEVEVAVPFRNQHIKWFRENVNTWKLHLDHANVVTYVDELNGTKYYNTFNGLGNYHPSKMHLRNQYMIDHSDLVVAVWDGSEGGTGNCVKYAKKLNKPMVIINPNNLK